MNKKLFLQLLVVSALAGINQINVHAGSLFDEDPREITASPAAIKHAYENVKKSYTLSTKAHYMETELRRHARNMINSSFNDLIAGMSSERNLADQYLHEARQVLTQNQINDCLHRCYSLYR